MHISTLKWLAVGAFAVVTFALIVVTKDAPNKPTRLGREAPVIEQVDRTQSLPADHCKPPVGRVLTISSKEDFQREVQESKIPVIVDFRAKWCVPCKVMAPSLDQLAAELDGKLKFVAIDVDELPFLATKYDASSVPLLLLFQNGTERHRQEGLKTLDELKELYGEVPAGKLPAPRPKGSKDVKVLLGSESVPALVTLCVGDILILTRSAACASLNFQIPGDAPLSPVLVCGPVPKLIATATAETELHVELRSSDGIISKHAIKVKIVENSQVPS